MYVCVCKAVTEHHVRTAVESGLRSPADLVAALQLDDPTNCGRCVSRAGDLLQLPCVQQALLTAPRERARAQVAV